MLSEQIPLFKKKDTSFDGSVTLHSSPSRAQRCFDLLFEEAMGRNPLLWLEL